MYLQNHTYISYRLDIDECIGGTHDCLHRCINTVGSFTCGCYDGYVQYGATCSGMYKLLVLFW